MTGYLKVLLALYQSIKLCLSPKIDGTSKCTHASYCPTGFVDSEDGSCVVRPGEWHSLVANDNIGCLQGINHVRGRRNRDHTIAMRDALSSYLGSEEGSLPW